MCTLTIVPRCDEDDAQGFRLAFNRDEELTRAPERAPSIEQHGIRRAILPRDADAGGTWIAVTDCGLAFALLNVNPPGNSIAERGGASRGVIIPSLLQAEGIEAVADMIPAVVHEVLRPYRLVVTDGRTWLEAVGGLGSVRCEAHMLTKPLMRTSSGLGDHVVEPPRRERFESMFHDGTQDMTATQDAFHSLRMPGADQLSVDMSREDARTVSNTVIEVTRDRVAMIHRASAPRDGVPPTELAIERREPGAGTA